MGGVGLAGAAQKDANPFAYDLERVSKTDPKLVRYEQVGRFACPAPGPRRLAVGPQDYLYIAARNGVSVLDPEGRRLDQIALGAPARCVAVAADGTVYAGLRDHVEVFDAKGRRSAAWESPGKKVWFTGLAVAGKDVFAADAGNRVVLHYDESGKVAGRIGEKSKERNVPGLIVPSPYLDVKIGRDGLLRVNNPGRHLVEVYTTNGDLESSWGKPTAAIEGFCGCCNPVGLALLPDGRYVTCEKGLPRVKIYSPEGAFQSVVAGPESFPENARAGALHDASDGLLGGLDAAVDSQGRIYVLDLVGADVRVMRAKAG
jgi:sugar lactone lactonase YvrE